MPSRKPVGIDIQSEQALSLPASSNLYWKGRRDLGVHQIRAARVATLVSIFCQDVRRLLAQDPLFCGPVGAAHFQLFRPFVAVLT